MALKRTAVETFLAYQFLRSLKGTLLHI